MRIFVFLFCLLAATATSLLAQPAPKLSVGEPTCEYQNNPLGIDVKVPRLSWKLVSEQRGVTQKSYELRVGFDDKALAKGANILWQSGVVPSDQSVLVNYGGPALTSRQRYYWQVRVVDNKGNTSAWSEMKWWETGLLQSSDWTAAWVEPDLPGDSVHSPAPMLRNAFDLKKMVKNARLYITSHGIYECFINGQRVGDQYLTPGWTSYNKRLQYQTYNVTTLLTNGRNATGVILSDGWYRGNLAWENNRNIYGKNLALLFQLEVTYTDGTKETIASNDQWKSSTGAVVQAGIYYGEAYDARLEKKDWTLASYAPNDWRGVRVIKVPNDNLVASYSPPVKKHETFKAKPVSTTAAGEVIYDFGQNLVGFVTFKVKGNAGDQVVIHHAEVLDKKGNFYLDNLRAAQAEVIYTLKGGVEETFEPHFSFFGFRYIRIKSKTKIAPENIVATTLYSDMASTGTFTSSNALINQLQHNIQWGQKGNFVDVPTDCPQRDERLGWTGDAQAFARTAAYNMNVATFFHKWLKDLAADQVADGRVPFVIPNVLGENASASAGWADAATIIPWNIYNAYGDKRILETQYESMKAWVGFMEKNSTNNLWNKGFHFGDWLFYRPNDDTDGRSAVTDKYLIAQCFFANSTQIMANTAKVLGKEDDAKRYTESLKKIKDAFVQEYMTPNGRLVAGTQTAYVLALNFDMLPENLRAQAADRLAQNVKDYGNHLTTGFLGTPYLCEVLTRYGYLDVAYNLLLQETYPSWLYPVKMGATTIWERWDGIKTDSTFQTPGMNSFNHYAYGAIGDWMYRRVTGLREAAPGYKEIIIAPQPGGNFKHATAELNTQYGPAKSAWKIENGNFILAITIPANTTAQVILPRAADAKITEGGIDISKLKSLSPLAAEGGDGKLQLGSGAYTFTYGWKP
ncbi:glycoside hydrolase family 78 protein [Chryseolinea lacunae]|uniref:alpha-L-rhamnosidase n=1 Tax=Chryseolinea lacunae TaxID=2801331 RepID=A0ABS1KLS6_9BACT|nr:glycoside hydrolase family 78 protein [Chryseolinea lacunae]MBL0740300.1 glycoside hydrolase family 78 protein [Chryseolinea lacunae]